MTPTTYYVVGEKSSPKFGAAFAAGCHGRLVAHTRGLQPGPFAAFCSPPVWPLLRRAQTERRAFYYGDHGYFGRGEFFRVTKNRYQHPGDGPLSTPERWRRFGLAIQPWRRQGRHIVICPNSMTYCGLHGFDAQQWTEGVAAALRAVTDRELRVRWKTDEPKRPLARDLTDAWAVVVYSSASALLALLHGVPVVTLAPFAATARMGLTDLQSIESPVYPDDRERFFSVLANNQWTLREMREGLAWRALSAPEISRAA